MFIKYIFFKIYRTENQELENLVNEARKILDDSESSLRLTMALRFTRSPEYSYHAINSKHNFSN